MKKSKKLLLYIGIPLFLIAIALALFFIHIYTEKFVYNNMAILVDTENADTQKLDEGGYAVNYPFFESQTDLTFDRQPVYSALSDVVWQYATDVATEYSNYAKLDYTVNHEGDTLTIAFTGYGYPDEGKGEPVSLDKTFVFDVKNVSNENPPRLISK